MKTIKTIWKVAALALAAFPHITTADTDVAPPAPFGATPTEQQVQWLRMEWYAFVHFGINTFTGKEWGYGDESPSLFNPKGVNADEIVRTFKRAGMTGMIYTAKHHDGFCLWPTKATSHNITKSPWKRGKGDVVKEFANACRKHGIKFGTYLSPWDRNCAEYGKPGYLKVYYKQIEELLTNYGPIFEIWFDGAMGGDGFYGGAREKRNIGNADDYYNYTEVVRRIRKLQPNCIIWGAAGRGDVTWGGSEKGHVKYPCWNIVNRNDRGENEKWLSLEGDTPINRAGWFWHENQGGKVKPVSVLMQVYMDSVGRGANLILNVAPDRTGKLDPQDVKTLLKFGELRRSLLAVDYALNAKAEANEVRGNSPKYAADNVTDGNIETYWCPEDASKSGELILQLSKPATFDVVRLREQIRLGQRVTKFEIDVWQEDKSEWITVDAQGETIGNQVMRRLPAPITTNRVRVRITASRACPCISEVSLLKMPEIDDEPSPSPQANRGALARGCVSRTEGGKAALDGNPSSFWHVDKAIPLEIDLMRERTLKGFSYLPRQDGTVKDMTDRYVIEVSTDGKKWKQVANGEFSNIRANPIELTNLFPKPVKARYFRFIGTSALEGTGASAAEINFIESK